MGEASKTNPQRDIVLQDVPHPGPLKILVVDDDDDVHQVTRFVCDGYTYKGQSVELLDANGEEQAMELIHAHPDIAVAIIDVVMEEHDSGLRLIQKIRESNINPHLRIILRTGQPGVAPEETVMGDYDIDNYLDKSELTNIKLTSSLTIALRSYLTMKALEAANHSLEEKVERRTLELTELNQNLEERVQSALRMQRELDARFRAIFYETGVGIIIMKSDRTILDVNPFFESLMGYTHQELVGKNCEDVSRDIPGEETNEKLNLLIAGSVSQVRYERCLFAREGVEKIGFFSVSAVHDTEGKVEYLISVIQDITQAKEIEQAKLRQDEQLLQNSTMAALGEMVAGYAHEINTPLGISVTAISVLQESGREIKALFDSGRIKKSDFNNFIERSEEAIAIVMSNVGRATDLIESLKHIAVDQSSQQIRTFNFREYMNEVLLSLKPQLKRTSHEVVVECDPHLVVESHPGYISQVFTNLIVNSLVHAFDKRKEPGEIRISIVKNDNELRATYRDNGKGMPPEVREKIFDQYFTTKKNEGGSGLGMYLIKEIVVQKLHGTIECESEEGKGSAFHITLPL